MSRKISAIAIIGFALVGCGNLHKLVPGTRFSSIQIGKQRPNFLIPIWVVEKQNRSPTLPTSLKQAMVLTGNDLREFSILARGSL
jgi:hypothetical protein